MIPDQKLSEHFSLYEMTRTDHADLLEQNRTVTADQIAKLVLVADLGEQMRYILNVPIIVHSAYRCPNLNARVGSSLRSQHLLCEAMDGSPKGMAVDEAFRKLVAAAKAGVIQFGQMIYEKAKRSYGTDEWIHLSLGYPYRAAERSGQILTMIDGSYTLLDTVPPKKEVI